MRFYDTDDETEIFWYEVPEDRPFVPFAHPFHSWEWEEPNPPGRRTPGTFGLGEQIMSDRSYRRVPVPRPNVFLGTICGTAADWQNGGGLPLVPPDPFPDGFPSCCGAVPTFPFPNGHSCELSHKLAVLTSLLYTLGPADQASFAEAASNAFGQPFDVRTWFPTPTAAISRHAVLTNAGWCLVVIGGTETTEQWIRQILRAGQLHEHHTNRRNPYQTNDLYFQNVERLLAAVTGVTNADTPVVVAGHSLGGAVALILGAELSQFSAVDRRVLTVTFGSPRCLDRVGASRTIPMPMHDPLNLWNEGDIIPFLPPHTSHVFRPTVMGVVQDVFLEAYWSNPPAQYKIDTRGVFHNEQPGGITGPALQAVIGTVSQDLPFAVPVQHEIGEYERRLSLQRCQEFPDANPSPVPGAPDLWLRGRDAVGDDVHGLAFWPPGPGTAISATVAVPAVVVSSDDFGKTVVLATVPGPPTSTNGRLALSQTFTCPADFCFFAVLAGVLGDVGFHAVSTTAAPGTGDLHADFGSSGLTGFSSAGIVRNPFTVEQQHVYCWRRVGNQFQFWKDNALVGTVNAAVAAVQINFIQQHNAPGPTGQTAIREIQGYKRALSVAEFNAVWSDLLAKRSRTVFPGQVLEFAKPVIIDGLLACDGTIWGEDVYPALFAVIGHDFDTWRGAAPPPAGSFRVPDYRGLVGVAAGAPGINPTTSDRTLLNTGGEETHALTVGELAAHSHGVTDPSHRHEILYRQDDFTPGGTDTIANLLHPAGRPPPPHVYTEVSATGLTVDPEGTGDPHNNMQPFAVRYYYIVATN